MYICRCIYKYIDVDVGTTTKLDNVSRIYTYIYIYTGSSEQEEQQE